LRHPPFSINLGLVAAVVVSTATAVVALATPASATPIAPGWLLERTGTNDGGYFGKNDYYRNSQQGIGRACTAAEIASHSTVNWGTFTPTCTEYRANAIISQVMDQPFAQWFSSQGVNDIQGAVRGYVGRANSTLTGFNYTVPQLVSYWIPNRDCASLSAGGAQSWDEYNNWMTNFANGVRDGLNQAPANPNRPVIVLLEPDALALQPGDDNCTINGWARTGTASGAPRNAAAQAEIDQRNAAINAAITKLHGAGTNVRVYLDAGHGRWKNYGGGTDATSNLGSMAVRLKNAGIAQADGFYTNASNYSPTTASSPQNERTYGDNLRAALATTTGGPAVPAKQQIIDTSRNGANPESATTGNQAGTGWPDWCDNVNGRLGAAPTLNTSDPNIAAYLWIKPPTETDGCYGNGNSPTAGQPPTVRPLPVPAGAFKADRVCQLLGNDCNFNVNAPAVGPSGVHATRAFTNSGVMLVEWTGAPGARCYDVVRDVKIVNGQFVANTDVPHPWPNWIGISGQAQLGDTSPDDPNFPRSPHSYMVRGYTNCLGGGPATPWSPTFVTTS
jgi:hypothetical protein